ncbi:MAG: Rab family GTPase [Mariprofundaceae bacterium]|nr:Rab family GTPase [Mariprofundaceae bacterium]
MIQKKVCMLGGFGVGKTSLVERFVYSRFTDEYISTMGLKIYRKRLSNNGTDVNMMVWDIYGEEDKRKVATSYMKGASGAILVADGTRPETLDTTTVLLGRLQDTLKVEIPWVLLINKHDLTDQWALSEAQLKALSVAGRPMYTSSAKTGKNVETAFEQLAQMMVRV